MQGVWSQLQVGWKRNGGGMSKMSDASPGVQQIFIYTDCCVNHSYRPSETGRVVDLMY
jgi:hypothetical protein